MMYYEICKIGDHWTIWKWCGDFCYERVKSFKTEKGARTWAEKQQGRVIWR